MVVRFITKRFIGEYDPNLEKVYTFNTLIDNEFVLFEILDAAGQPNVITFFSGKAFFCCCCSGLRLTDFRFTLFRLQAGGRLSNARGQHTVGGSVHPDVLGRGQVQLR